MGYFIFVLLLFLFVAIGLVFAKSKLSSKTKIILGICILSLALLIGVYNLLQNKQTLNLERLKTAFVSETPLICNFQGKQLRVTTQNFTLSNGTMSFQGRADSKYNRIIIPLQDCDIESESADSKTSGAESADSKTNNAES